MASGEVPGNSHHFWCHVTQGNGKCPKEYFFVSREAGKSLPPGPSQAQPSGWTLSAMWLLYHLTHLYLSLSPSSDAFGYMPVSQGGWHSPGKPPGHLN